MTSPGEGAEAVVVGTSGGIGHAILNALEAGLMFDVIHAWSRSEGPMATDRIRPARVDITDEASIRAAAERIEGAVRLVIVATGLLHQPGMAPEKSVRAIDPASMVESFRVNTIGPMLVAKHLLPRTPAKGRVVFAALSARVGSIGDNRLGGWYAYRASKAALNMMIRTLSIEAARRNPESICIGLHPGTVDTGVSRPFQANVPEGRLFAPDQAARHLLKVIEGAGVERSGQVLAWDGTVIPP